MAQVKDWLEAFRLRTLPLALACIGMGSFLAAADGVFRGWVLALSVLTSIFLQILSNLANDYGDTQHGADSEDRTGPSRTVQAGKITAKAMKRAIYLFAFFSLVSGLALLGISVRSPQDFWLFLSLGLLAIAAAITYTVGKRPYGYMGLGDISVFLFFGCLGVLGTYYLHAGTLHYWLILPAASCGLFATAVLNLNNIRDIESDKKAGKNSIPVRLGRARAVYYHWALLLIGLMCSVLYVYFSYSSPWQYLFLMVIPLLLVNARAVLLKTRSEDLDPFLKQMAISTLIYVLTFGVGQLF